MCRIPRDSGYQSDIKAWESCLAQWARVWRMDVQERRRLEALLPVTGNPRRQPLGSECASKLELGQKAAAALRAGQNRRTSAAQLLSNDSWDRMGDEDAGVG